MFMRICLTAAVLCEYVSILDIMELGNGPWTAVLFYLGDNKSRGCYRCLSTMHQAFGENARKVLFDRSTVPGKMLRPAGLRRIDFWTPWVQRHRFYEPDRRVSSKAWAAWKAISLWRHSVSLTDPDRGNYVLVRGAPSAERRHSTFVNREWVDNWQLYMR